MVTCSSGTLLGLPLPGSVSNKVCGKSKRKKGHESSEEEDEWQPWMDEKVKRRCSERIGKLKSAVSIAPYIDDSLIRRNPICIRIGMWSSTK